MLKYLLSILIIFPSPTTGEDDVRDVLEEVPKVVGFHIPNKPTLEKVEKKIKKSYALVEKNFNSPKCKKFLSQYFNLSSLDLDLLSTPVNITGSHWYLFPTSPETYKAVEYITGDLANTICVPGITYINLPISTPLYLQDYKDIDRDWETNTNDYQ